MRFVKFKCDSVGITKSKEYKILLERKKEFCFIDNDDETRIIEKCDSDLEIIDRPVMVKAWDNDGDRGLEFELIHDLGELYEFRYICKYNNGNMAGWKNVEYIEPKLTLEQRIEKLEQQLNNK